MRALDGRVPDNSLLSHDLFECLYARAALTSDIELLDDYPAHYDTFALRQHRWTRGNWQIARWLLPHVRGALLGDGDRAGELFALLNPINHASTRAGLHKYKVEPYVAAADVYAIWPHTGRGGWTWYTGSASWMYRAGLEFILGFRLQGERLLIAPCIPRWWREYEINYRYGRTRYRISVENPAELSRGVALIEADGVAQATDEIALTDDGAEHRVRVVRGESRKAADEEQPEATRNYERDLLT